MQPMQPNQPGQPNRLTQPAQPMQPGAAPQQAPQQPGVPQPQQLGAGGYVPPQPPVNAGVKPRGTASLVCGIIGIVLAAISFILGLVITFGILGSAATSSFDSPSSSSSTSSSSAYPEELTADEQACYDLGIRRFETLKNQDPAMVQSDR